MICIVRMQCGQKHTMFAIAGDYPSLATAERHRDKVASDMADMLREGWERPSCICGSEVMSEVEVFLSPWPTLDEAREALAKELHEQILMTLPVEGAPQ